ncbi:MAG: hypothetical protein IJ471_07210 [Eubacterium sp.]|nr:hypothetical protein [Eubacterium sp.]
MGKDTAFKRFFTDDRRFADVINAFGCHGEQYVKPEDLTEVDSREGIWAQNVIGSSVKKEKSSKQKDRDVVRKVAFGTNFAIMGVENQEIEDYGIAYRVMSYDVSRYAKQVEEIKKQVRDKAIEEGALSEGEYLYRFPKDSRLHPVVTFVLYYGEESFDGATDLHGLLDFSGAFARSCNSAFSQMGMDLDRISFANTLQGLLFHTSLPFDLPHKKSSVVIESEMTSNEIMQTAIGQGKTQITPLHLNLITATIANDGVLMKPRILEKVETAEGALLKAFPAEEYAQLLSTEEAAVLTGMMEQVVSGGTGIYLNNEKFSVAGKTGSAEYNAAGESHAWFTGFAPVEAPEICVTILVEGAGSGSEYAVPIAKKILDFYFEESGQ